MNSSVDRQRALEKDYSEGLITSLEFLEGMIGVATVTSRKHVGRPALTVICENVRRSTHVPVILERVVEDIDALIDEMQKFGITEKRYLEVRKRLREIIWVKYRIRDHDFFEAAYIYVSNYYS